MNEDKNLLTSSSAPENAERRTNLEDLRAGHPLFDALLSMTRHQRRAFGSELKRMQRKKVAGGLGPCFMAARRAGWMGKAPELRIEHAPAAAPRKYRTPDRCERHGEYEAQPVEGLYAATCPRCNAEAAAT